MPTFAAQTLADAVPTITPEEPTTLSLMLVGAGALAVYAVLSGRWRRAGDAAVRARVHAQETVESTDVVRRAA